MQPRNHGSMSIKVKFSSHLPFIFTSTCIHIFSYLMSTWVLRDFARMIKQQERKAEDSSLPAAEAKNCGSVTPLSCRFS